MAGRHPQPRHPPLLRSLTEKALPPDNSDHYRGPAARWYDAVYGWRIEDIPFYRRLAEEWAGPAGAVLELGAGSGRITLPLARAGFHVTAVDSSPDMVEILERRLAAEPEAARRLVEPVRQDIRRLHLDRLYRLVCLPFNTLLMLSQPHDRHQALNHVREHLAPSGAFAFEVFTPDPERLRPSDGWEVDLEHEIDDPREGRLRVRREVERDVDLGRQLLNTRFRCRVARTVDDAELASWGEEMSVAYIFPRELDLLLERQGFRVKARYGGPDMRPYEPRPGDVQPQYVVAQLLP